jgi:pimeloyl-ACP methyl ester carboxylesterase
MWIQRDERDRVEGLHKVEPTIEKAKRLPPRLSVVFVHGLRGGGFSTWNAGDKTEVKFWPESLAARNPDCAVWTANYRTTVLDSVTRNGVRMGLLDRAAWFIEALRREHVAAHPIVFVAHSFGGLVVKQALQFADSLGVEEWKPIGTHTRAVVFLATPHEGSSLANFASGAASLTTPRWLLKTSPIVQDLERDAALLRYLKVWYRDYAQQENIKTRAYAERRETGKTIVVDAGSADPGIPGQISLPLEESHLSIAKPARVEAPVFADLEALIREVGTTDAVSAPLDLVNRICGFWWGRVRDAFPHESDLACIRIRKTDGLPSLAGKSFRRNGEIVAEWNSVASAVTDESHEARIKFVYLYEARRRHDEKNTRFIFGYATVWFNKPADTRGLAKSGSSDFTSIYEAASPTPSPGGTTAMHANSAASANWHDAGATAKTRKQDWIRVEHLADAEALWDCVAAEPRKEVVARTLAAVFGK